jgi:hypothetical protein
MYLYCNIAARSHNDVCLGKAISIKYYKSVCILALVILHAKCISSTQNYEVYCHLWSVLYRIFPHYLTNGKIFGKKSFLT